MITTKLLVTGAGAVGAFFLGRYLLRMNRLSNELETITKVNVDSISLTGLRLKINVQLKNPTAATVNVKYPFVKMLYGDTVFATSDVKNEDKQIAAHSQTDLEPIYVNVSFLTLIGKLAPMLADLRKNGKVNILARTTTTINNLLPYTKEDTISLSNPLS